MSDTETVTLTKRLTRGSETHEAGDTITVSKAEASELRAYIVGSDEPQQPAPVPNGTPKPDLPDPNKVPPGQDDDPEEGSEPDEPEEVGANGSRVKAKARR